MMYRVVYCLGSNDRDHWGWTCETCKKTRHYYTAPDREQAATAHLLEHIDADDTGSSLMCGLTS
jgi:hypothetical protein